MLRVVKELRSRSLKLFIKFISDIKHLYKYYFSLLIFTRICFQKKVSTLLHSYFLKIYYCSLNIFHRFFFCFSRTIVPQKHFSSVIQTNGNISCCLSKCFMRMGKILVCFKAKESKSFQSLRKRNNL